MSNLLPRQNLRTRDRAYPQALTHPASPLLVSLIPPFYVLMLCLNYVLDWMLLAQLPKRRNMVTMEGRNNKYVRSLTEKCFQRGPVPLSFHHCSQTRFCPCEVAFITKLFCDNLRRKMKDKKVVFLRTKIPPHILRSFYLKCSINLL